MCVCVVVIMHVITRNDKMSGISTVIYTEPYCIYNILADYKISCAIVSYNSSLIRYSFHGTSYVYSIHKTHLSNNSYVEYKYCAFALCSNQYVLLTEVK